MNIVDLSCGTWHVLALSADRNTVFSAGSNKNGECGREGNTAIFEPLDFTEESVSQISAGYCVSFIVGASSKKAFSFGKSPISLQKNATSKPLEVKALEAGVSEIAQGATYAACVMEDGRLFTWGENKFG